MEIDEQDKEDKQFYMRIGIQIYKKTKRPLTTGGDETILQRWNKETLYAYELGDLIKEMDMYDGFCNIPSHLNYQQSIGKYYNQYYQIDFQPSKGSCEHTLSLIKHLFGEQYELALDYLKLLLEKPLQKLPILCLVSRERGTAKSTFLYLLKIMFEANAKLIDNEALDSNFNSSWANALLAMIEETLLTKKNQSERLKNLSTAFNYQSESKGIDRADIEMITKFVLCSNNENNLIYIEPGETRFWIVQAPVLKNTDPNFKNKLQAEKQHFYHFLVNRIYSTICEDRMWFNPELLVTDALKKVMHYSRNPLELELIELIRIIMECKDFDTLEFTVGDVQQWFKMRTGKNVQMFEVKNIICSLWELEQVNNSLVYPKVSISKNNTIEIDSKAKGRYFSITKDQLRDFDEMMM